MSAKDQVIESQRRIIDALAECEARIGMIYEKYAAKFLDTRDDWMRLSKAEKTHADLLKSMHRILDKGNLFFNLGKFSHDAIQPMARLIDESLKQAEDPGLTFDEAMGVALRIETSIMDAHFYDIVASDAPEFKIIAQRLSVDTKKHAGLILHRFGARLNS